MICTTGIGAFTTTDELPSTIGSQKLGFRDTGPSGIDIEYIKSQFRYGDWGHFRNRVQLRLKILQGTQIVNVILGWAKNNLRKRSTTDSDTRFGFKEKILDKPFFVFGYRATIACDAEGEIPLLTVITPANANESRLYPTILRQTKDLGNNIEVVTADKLFDSKRNIALTIGYKAIRIIGLNTRGSSYAKQHGKRRGDIIPPIQRDSEHWRHYYAMRSASERLFSSLKEQLGFATLKARGLARVASFFTLCVIAKLLAALTALRLGRHDHTKSALVWSYG